MPYYSLQHQTLLSPTDTSTTEHCFHFGPVSSFFLEQFLHPLPVAYWTSTNLAGQGSSSSVIIFLPFQTVHGVLEARILEWFAIPFSSGPRFVRTLPHDSPLALNGMALSFLLSPWLAFCDSGFHSRGCGTAVLASSVYPLMDEDKRLV